MENLGCQDILRHDSPCRQGVCQSSTALWDCWTQPWCLWSSNQRCLRFRSHCWRFLLSGMDYWLSMPSVLLYMSFFIPCWALCSLSFQLCDPACCPLPFLILVVNARAPLSGPAAVVSPPHCALSEASARTRCLLMASSRYPATFSLSSYKAQGIFLRVDLKC